MMIIIRDFRWGVGVQVGGGGGGGGGTVGQETNYIFPPSMREPYKQVNGASLIGAI